MSIENNNWKNNGKMLSGREPKMKRVYLVLSIIVLALNFHFNSAISLYFMERTLASVCVCVLVENKIADKALTKKTINI